MHGGWSEYNNSSSGDRSRTRNAKNEKFGERDARKMEDESISKVSNVYTPIYLLVGKTPRIDDGERTM